MSKIEIICGDSLEIMKQYPDNYFSLCLTDPPYGRRITRKDNQFGSSTHLSYRATGESWDDKPPSKEYFDELFRISKKQIIFGGNHFALPISEKWIVWDKVGGFEFDNPFSSCELAWTSMSGVIEKYTVIQQGFVKDTADKRYHPSQKPSELFFQILQKHCKQGETVLDAFAGSGTCGVACERIGRDCTLIEINEKYYQDCCKRVQEEKDKMGLFNGD